MIQPDLVVPVAHDQLVIAAASAVVVVVALLDRVVAERATTSIPLRALYEITFTFIYID